MAGRRPSYHHGDLRNALLDAALTIVREEGADALGMRAVARRVGVSNMAPYHHFEDRGALVAAVAAHGFRGLTEAMERHMAETAGGPGRQLQEAGVAYVRYALENPQLFRLMFGPAAGPDVATEELQEEGSRTMRTLTDAIGQATGARGPDVEEVALASWSLVHGLAVLLLDGQVGEVTVAEGEARARAATGILWEGLQRGMP